MIIKEIFFLLCSYLLIYDCVIVNLYLLNKNKEENKNSG